MRLIALALGVLFAVPLALIHLILRASLPALDGELAASRLSNAVSIERDALGIPTISAADRNDLAFGTGFAHAQDRFFQMDLSRRLAAGELSALFGPAAAEQDRKARVFQFRKVARTVIGQANPRQRELVEAYARGVNAGLASLRSRPWEYWVLRSKPVEWRAEDTILVVHAMWWDLQYAGFRREQVRGAIETRLGAGASFFYPNRSQWDAPNESGHADQDAPAQTEPALTLPRETKESSLIPSLAPWKRARVWASSSAGSNNWAVAGRLTATGGALVANDMHLGLRVPTTWYRARLRTATLDLNGVTLPGAPILVAGSNGHIAWGYTNSYGNWLDLDRHAWLAAVPEATNLHLMSLETAASVDEALALAPHIGIPHQNLIVGDRAGHIGWTIIGRIPLEMGSNRSDGSSSWLPAADYPRIVDPPGGRLWSANARATDDPRQELAIGGDEALLGADYDLGARAQQIRDALFALKKPATPGDMLAIQLDDRARFLARWRDLLLGLLNEATLRGQPRRAELKRLIFAWNGRASVDSVGYRLVREFRNRTESAVWQTTLQRLGIEDIDAPAPARFEEPLWTLITTQPRWHALLLRQIDATISASEAVCGSLAQCTWGKRNRVRVRHPLSSALPGLSGLLDMPAVELAGDHDMPRVQDGAFGASERFAVTPGRESAGYLHIAGGQSGHPLSPYFRAGFHEWAAGTALPFLAGEAEHRFVLAPR